MTRKVITARMDEPIDAVVRKMERHNISALPVVDAERKVIGIVTSDDISKLLKKGRKWLRLRI